MTKEKGLGESQMRAGKEEGTRDPRPSQKMTMMLRTMNCSTSCPKLWWTPLDDGRDSQGKPLPSSKTKKTKIYACGY